METKTRKEKILQRSRIEGLRAPVDSVPDFSEGNLQHWKTRLLTYFGCAADNISSEMKADKEMRGEILAAMKSGFKELILSQPYVDEPFSPRESAPRTETLRIMEEVFAELPHSPHHCAT